MSESPDAQLRFRKRDIVALHSLPSAQAHDPFIVHAPHRRSLAGRLVHWAIILVALLFLCAAALVAAIESGLADAPLNARAERALNSAIGNDYHADVGRTVLRVTSAGRLALKAQDVVLYENVSNRRLVTTQSVFIELDPLALLTGRVAVSRLEATGATLDPSLLPQGKPIDLTAIRVADLGHGLEAFFDRIDAMSQMIGRSNTKTVSLSDLRLSFAGPRNRLIPVIVDSIDFDRSEDGSMTIAGLFSVDGQPSELHLSANRVEGRVRTLDGALTGLPLSTLLRRGETASEPAFGITSSADLTIRAVRADVATAPVLEVNGRTNQGAFDAGGFTSELKPSEFAIAYDFSRHSIEILPSVLRIAQSVFPFTGAVGDITASEQGGKKGFSLNLLLQSASAAPVDVPDAPLVFDAKAQGYFLSETHELLFNELTVSSGLGNASGSLAMRFGDVSPQISFALLTDRMQSTAVKQLWPWWVGRAPRRWVINNLFGGTVTDASVGIFLPMGRLTHAAGPVELNPDELNVHFDIDDARVNIAGDIPPLRDAAGSLSLKGERLDVEIKSGTAYFPSGRSVKLNGGNFVIPSTYLKPLIAEMKVDVAGAADAIAELVTYRPIRALQHTPFTPEDFSGQTTASVGARFGLIAAQNPPAPEWQAEIALDDVALKKPIAGRTISDINGTLRVDQRQAVLDAKAKIDGAPMDLALTEPVGSGGNVKRQREISGTLDTAAFAKLAPGLQGIVSGPVGLDIALDENNGQTVVADLDNASISLPWIGWSKGPGIGAKAAFSAATEDGVVQVKDLKIDGDNFGAKGSLVVDKSGLNTAQFSSVELTRGDDYSVNVKRQKNGYMVAVKGTSADVRPVIDTLRNPSGGKGGGDARRITIDAALDQVSGFNSQTLSNFKLTYAGRGGQIDGLTLSAVTGSGQAVVAKMSESGADNTLQLTSGDAGALARFANLYGNMRGGLLNLKLRDRGASSWQGSVDIRKFSLVDEARLQSMVSTPTGADGRSLNQAVKKNIDVSSAKFERGFADIVLNQGQISIDNGVVRGVDIGATFQGVLHDKNGNMNMTGTFMPAYGLNRLFGELPLIGAILGNGRDRGLLGITFRVSGPFSKPSLRINPLSIIAPGVFRNIFEFQ